jgi:hypothetical protein
MKRAFTIGLLLLTVISKAQTVPDVCNLSLTDSSLRILYIGVENRLQLSGVKKPEEITMTISGAGANIHQVQPVQFIVWASATGQSTLSVFRSGKLLRKIVFDVRVIDIPLAGLNSKRNTTLRKSQLYAAPWLNLYFEHAKLRLNQEVVSFSMKSELNGDTVIIESKSNQLNQQQINIIRQLNSGSIIFFEDIRVSGADSRTTKAEPFWIKIE